ncbi:MAG: hypothetical protein NVSMB23_29400 [Myxococcales bacterium]
MDQGNHRDQPGGFAGPEGLDEGLARELLEHYLAGADERLSSFAQVLAESQDRPADPAALEALRRLLHKIAGSAGTYGFPELTRTARRLEQEVIAARQAPPGGLALFAAARAFHAEMSAAFAQAACGLQGSAGVSAEAPRAGRDENDPAPFAAVETNPAPSEARPAASAVRERLVVAVIAAAATRRDPGAEAAYAERAGVEGGGAEAVGAALAAAGTHLLGTGSEEAARGYRTAGGEGLVLWIVPGLRGSASRWVDLPLRASGLPAQCAVALAAADGAIVIGGGGEALAHCGFFLREGKPVVALLESGGAASLLSGRELDGALVVAATSAEDAVLELLTRLSAGAAGR